MKIELKNVKHSEFASHETDCFEASVYLDGKRAGMVSNDGHGGCNDYHPWQMKEQIDAYAATLPPTVFEDIQLQPNADILIGDLLNAYLRLKEHKRICRNRTVFRIPGRDYAPGQYHTYPKAFDINVKLYLMARHGADTFFLNEHMGKQDETQ